TTTSSWFLDRMGSRPSLPGVNAPPWAEFREKSAPAQGTILSRRGWRGRLTYLRQRTVFHDRESHVAFGAVTLRKLAPGAFRLVARRKRTEQPLGAADKLLETKRLVLAAEDPETIVHGRLHRSAARFIPPRSACAALRIAHSPSTRTWPWSKKRRR